MNNYKSYGTRRCPYCGEVKVIYNSLVVPPHHCKITEEDAFKTNVVLQIYGGDVLKSK